MRNNHPKKIPKKKCSSVKSKKRKQIVHDRRAHARSKVNRRRDDPFVIKRLIGGSPDYIIETPSPKPKPKSETESEP